MKVEFFEKEVMAIQARFNETFGRQRVCDLKTRQQVILSIIYMGLLCRQISTSGMTDETRARILRLLKVRDTLHSIFDKFEANYKERRTFNNECSYTIRENSKSNRSRKHGQSVPTMRKSVCVGVAQGRG